VGFSIDELAGVADPAGVAAGAAFPRFGDG